MTAGGEKNTLVLAINYFSIEDLNKIQNFFLYKYQIKVNIHKNHIIYIPSKYSKIFYSLIELFIHENCKYKIKQLF